MYNEIILCIQMLSKNSPLSGYRLTKVWLVMLQELTMGAGITDDVMVCLKKCLSHCRT